MKPRQPYTVQDANGNTVQKGDTVTIAFTGVVRSVEREGHLVIANDRGVIAAYTPGYQQLYKRVV